MYHVVSPDGQQYPADLNALMEWAKEGRIHPHSLVVDAATGHQIRADQLIALQPVFAAQNQKAGPVPPPVTTTYQPVPSRKPPMPLVKKVLWGGGAFFAFILFCGIVAPPKEDAKPKTEPVKSAATATAALAPTHSQPTPKPAARPKPKPPIPKASQEASQNPALLLDKDWKTRAAVGCIGLTMGGKGLEDIHPVPKECRAIHKKVKQLARISQQISTSYAHGVDHLQSSDIQDATKGMSDVTVVGHSVAAEIRELRSHYREE